jgi:hypothetical protein
VSTSITTTVEPVVSTSITTSRKSDDL